MIRSQTTKMPFSRRLAVPLLLVVTILLGCSRDSETPEAEGVSAQMRELRDRGLGHLENEKPEQAELAFRALLALLPNAPLPRVNLAIALLRQQQLEQAKQILQPLLKGQPSARSVLLAGLIEQQAGDMQQALILFAQAFSLDPSDSEVVHTAFNLASQMRGDAAAALAQSSLNQLVQLRPDNPWIVLKRLQRALEEGDREAATTAYLRLRELAWRFDQAATAMLEGLGEQLKDAQLGAARGDTLRLENLLRATDLYRESLRELRVGIVGVPIHRFTDEANSAGAKTITPALFTVIPLTQGQGLVLDLAVGDLDADGRPDLLQLTTVAEDQSLTVHWHLAAAEHALSGSQKLSLANNDAPRLTLLDLDNDDDLDLLVSSSGGSQMLLGDGVGGFAAAIAGWQLDSVRAASLAALDFDIEGDLDLIGVSTEGQLLAFRNSLSGALESVGEAVFARSEARFPSPVSLSPADLDRDGDVDLLLLHGGGVTWLDNLRYGEMAPRSPAVSFDLSGSAAATADVDNDGMLDVVVADSQRITIALSVDASFPKSSQFSFEHQTGVVKQLLIGDFDNNASKDVLVRGEQGTELFQQGQAQLFERVKIDAPGSDPLIAVDMDMDGRLDLVAAGVEGIVRLANQTQSANGWLSLRLKGLTNGNSKNNSYGIGSSIEIRSGQDYQLYEVSRDHTHIGLGDASSAEVLRVLWTNGVPQNRFDLARDQFIVEEQVLKGSCPFLYAWNGERFVFVTDLLWGAPLGLPLAPGVWLPADPSELVRVDGLVPLDGRYELKITEELWEAAFFDQVRLWVVDHAADVEVASSLRIVPGQSTEDRVLASRQLQPLAQAFDGHGKEVTEIVAQRDEVYADGYTPSRYQGVAADPWSFTMDLGRSPNGPVRLLLEGWIFPADASLNLAVAQRADLPYLPPSIEVETAQGWQLLADNVGFPAGKTKVMVIDLPALPSGSQRIRMVSNLWLHWDRIRWTEQADDAAHSVVAKLNPERATLRERGYSQLLRKAPNAPHSYDYDSVSLQSPWQTFPGRYTRLGEVTPLLLAVDDFSVILAAGDELSLRFAAQNLPPPAPGMRRTLFLESYGWDKDADLNTFQAQQLEPLPFTGMSGYPGKPGEQFPDTPEHRAYQAQWLTRELR